MAGAVYFISIPGVTDSAGAGAGASASASRPQLQQVQSQPNIAGQGGGASPHARTTRTSVDSTSLPYPGDAATAAHVPPASAGYAEPHMNPRQQQHAEDRHPHQAPGSVINSFSGSGSGSGSGVGVGGSPSAASSTPSWVLPKASGGLSAAHGSGAQLNSGAGPGGSHFEIRNQFAGMSVSDPSA